MTAETVVETSQIRAPSPNDRLVLLTCDMLESVPIIQCYTKVTMDRVLTKTRNIECHYRFIKYIFFSILQHDVIISSD